MHRISPWRIVATLISGPAVAVALGVYMELADAPILDNIYQDGVRVVCTAEPHDCWGR